MRKMFSVLHYEYKMQFKRLVTWGCTSCSDGTFFT